MYPIPLNQLLAGLAPAGSLGGEPVTAVVTDSRKVQPGCVLVCFPGRAWYHAMFYDRGAY